MKEQVKQALKNIPKEKLPRNFKARLVRLGEMVDQLALLDEQSQEVYADERSFRNLLKEHLPPEFEDHCIDKLRTLPGSRFVTDDAALATAGNRLKHIPWEDLASRPGVFKTAPAPFSLSESPTPNEIRQVVQQLFPTIPDYMFEPAILQGRLEEIVVAPARAMGIPAAEAIGAAQVPSSVWDCVVRNLGFWAAIALVAVIVAACIAWAAAIVVAGPMAAGVGTLGSIVVFMGGEIAMAAFWAVFWGWFTTLAPLTVALGTLGYIINCIINPSWQS